MSRAFTKEADYELPPSLPDRVIATGPNPVTPRGAEQIEALLKEISQRFHSEKSDTLARDLRYWEVRRATMEVVPPQPNPDRAGFGARVLIRRKGRETEIQIVGIDEANATAGLISWTSPLARAIDGASAGDTVYLEINGTEEPISILAIRRADK